MRARTDLPGRLRARERIPEPVALVVAHPDDETLALGGLLDRFDRLTLVHLTDGAPRDGEDAARLGYSSWQAYAAAREDELRAALDVLGTRAERRSYGVSDKGVVDSLEAVARRLAVDLAGQAVVITHAYEGGHPDHDAAALGVRLALDGMTGGVPAHLEFAGYHRSRAGAVHGRFWPDAACPETVIALSGTERERLGAGFRAHASQAGVLAAHSTAAHRLRDAPAYDFRALPPPGGCLYDEWGWELTGEVWRGRAASQDKTLFRKRERRECCDPDYP